MKRFSVFFAAMVFAVSAPALVNAQSWPSAGNYGDKAPASPAQGEVRPPEGLKDYVVDGKLRLALQDAVRLALLNNTDIRVDQTSVDQARYALKGSFQPFDPLVQSRIGATRSTSPTFSQLQGAPTLSDLEQQASVGYLQTLGTGTQFQLNFAAGKSSSNNRFVFFNPSIVSSLNFTLTQPLLRNRGLLPNRAPVLIARRNLEQSRANFEAQVSNLLAQAVNQYWSVVLAREDLEVQRRSLEQAEESYKRNKRELELGALAPLEIYRSESQVATRRLQVIQSEYALRQSEDQLRRVTGADLDPFIRALDLELVEPVEPAGELANEDEKTALEQAMSRRPELAAMRQLLDSDTLGVRVANNHLKPDLSLNLLYSSSGLAGNEFDTTVNPPALISRGGLGDAVNQTFGFGFPVYGFNLQLNLPLRNRGAEAALGNALVGKRRDLYMMRQLQQAITLEVTNAVHQLEQAKLSIAAAKVAEDLTRKNLEAEQRKYELGAETIFFVLDAQSQLAQAEVSLVQSEVSYQRAVNEVARATGSLLSRYRVKMEDFAP